MIGADSVVAIAAGLADLLQVRDPVSDPQLHLIFLPDSPQRRDDRIFLTLGAAFWRQRSRDHHGAVLADVERYVELLHATAGSWMPDLSRLPGATLVGCALMYDGSAATPSIEPETAGRVVIARDTDGRLYHGAALADRTIRPLIAFGKLPDERATAVADALATVLDHRIAGVYQLPATGYILLHQTHRDGEQPQTVSRYIDATNTMNDDDATTYAREELQRLRSTATNVVHTLRLIHRTTSGDRDIWTGAPVRGDKPPLP
jgi:hypothetical protein